MIARRYRGYYSGPLDARLLAMPWWEKQGIWRTHLIERIPPGKKAPADVYADTGKLAEWIGRQQGKAD